MVDLDLRPGRRQAVLEQITRALAHATKGSEVGLRGSLAVGAADAYSDIDLCWVVPDVQFETAVASVGYALARVERVVSLRLDPDYARSDRRRLIFARLAGMPLFWRVDLDIRAASVAEDDSYDDDNPAARSEEGWSRAASAIENAIGAIKAVLRHQSQVAEGSLLRGYQRIGHPVRSDRAPQEEIVALARACAAEEPRLRHLAVQVYEVVEALF